MKKIILTRGLPGSGKTTWAKKMLSDFPGQYRRVNKDELRSMMDEGKYSKHNEQNVLNIRDQIILGSLDQGRHVIVDDTNLSTKHENRIRELVKGVGSVCVKIEDFTDVSVSECIANDLKRLNSVGHKVIKNMHSQFLEKEAAKVLEQDENLPRAIICDLDGTLALMNGRSPYEPKKCAGDARSESVYSVIKKFYTHGHRILFVSGRDGEAEGETREWLKKNIGVEMFSNSELFMRKEGDNRKDSVIKEELYNGHIKDKYYIEFVLDDRMQVVDFWRSKGLTCFQVAPGDF